MFFRKWTRMEWWDSVRYFKKYGMLEYREEHRLLHLFPPTWQQYLPTANKLREISFSDQKDKLLVNSLFKKYPDLRYDTSGRIYDRSGAADNYANYAVRFVLKQKQLMKQGMKQEAAFLATEKLFQDRMQRKMDQNNLTRGIAMNNRARSFMSFYQQQAEKEARLKVMRMKRDVHQYVEERETFQQEINDDGDMEMDFDENHDETMYNRVLFKLQNKGTTEQSQEKNRAQKEFVERSESMFKVYYERAAIYDRLQGLTDSQIREEIQNSPSKMKKRTRALLKKLEKLGVVLTESGEVNFSAVKNENLRKKLEANQNVKIALMLRDLEFEHAHKEHQMEQAVQLKQQLGEVQEARNIYVKDIMEIAGQPFKMKEPMFSYEQTHDTREEFAEKAKEAKRQGELYLEKAYLDSLHKPLITSPATYKLFESYEERVLRIEEKWLRNQINIVNEGDAGQTKEEQLQQVIDKLRRTKYKIDQLSAMNAQNLMFEEHEVFGDEILLDQKVGYEELRNYLFQPSDVRRKTETDITNDNLISEMSKISISKEDVKNPYADDFASRILLEDTEEFKTAKQNKIRQLRAERERSEQDSQKLDALQRFKFEDDQEEVGDITSQLGSTIGKISKKKSKGSKGTSTGGESLMMTTAPTQDEDASSAPIDEKRKILDFIKKANDKKVLNKIAPKSS